MFDLKKLEFIRNANRHTQYIDSMRKRDNTLTHTNIPTYRQYSSKRKFINPTNIIK